MTITQACRELFDIENLIFNITYFISNAFAKRVLLTRLPERRSSEQ